MDEIVVFELVLPKKKTGKKSTNVTKMVESFKYNSESENERSRGGESINPNSRFHLKRNNSGGNFARSEIQGSYQYSPSPRKMSLGNENANVYTPPFNSFHHQQQQQQYYEIPPRRMSNVCSPIQMTMDNRKYSNCSDGYSTCSEAHSRRQSLTSDLQRRLSNYSEVQAPPSPQSRRSSVSCSDHCSCGSRRISQYSNDSYRRLSNSSTSDFPRKFSNGSATFGDRKYSTASTSTQPESRRISFDTGFERKISSGSINYERKYSNGFDPLRKLSYASDFYINGRKISTDSGYDRRMSINSTLSYDNENPIMRSRNNSLVCPNHLTNEPLVGSPLVRKPLGPDPEGGKGFGSRTRKIGLVATPNGVSA
jgi:la-related protein 6